MTTKPYTVTGSAGANLRELPSGKSAVVTTLAKGAACTVVTDWTATNTAGGETTKYLCIKHGGKYLWCAASLLAVKVQKVDYLSKAAAAAKVVYPLCIGKTHSGTNVAKVISLATLKAHHALTCNRMASIVLQEAGCLDNGVIVSHTAKKSGKKSIADAVSGYKKLKNCKVVWVDKLFKDLPAEYKKAGCVYYQDSNACVSAGGGYIWSCNKSKGYKYKSKSDYYRDSGYPFTSKILVVVVPNS